MGKQFLQQQKDRDHKFFAAGMETGCQLMLDTVAEVLHDPAVMGHDTFGKDRLVKFLTACAKDYDYWMDAILKTKSNQEDERFAVRQRLDDKLLSALGDRADLPFEKRYPYISQVEL